MPRQKAGIESRGQVLMSWVRAWGAGLVVVGQYGTHRDGWWIFGDLGIGP
jgi:hypothetical protein